MPPRVLNKNEINILYAPFADVDTSVAIDLSKAGFEKAFYTLKKSNNHYADTARYWIIVSIEEQFNACRILLSDKRLFECFKMPLKDAIIPTHLKRPDDWFIVKSTVDYEGESAQEFDLSESSSFIYGKYLAVNKDYINT